MTGTAPGEAAPWGWWLRQKGTMFDDGEGGSWRSVRDAFWRGHLRMLDDRHVEEQQDLLLRVLGSVVSWGTMYHSESCDLFDGNVTMRSFYLNWLASIGMLDVNVSRMTGTAPSLLDAGRSDEGYSVLRMLPLTRKWEWERLPMREVVEAVARSGWNLADQAREAALRLFEQAVERRRCTFAREGLAGSFLVTLTGIAEHARMPTLGIMWSLRSAESRPRDDLFAWLATRVDRRDERAYRRGADDFPRHLLTLFLANEYHRQVATQE